MTSPKVNSWSHCQRCGAVKQSTMWFEKQCGSSPRFLRFGNTARHSPDCSNRACRWIKNCCNLEIHTSAQTLRRSGPRSRRLLVAVAFKSACCCWLSLLGYWSTCNWLPAWNRLWRGTNCCSKTSFNHIQNFYFRYLSVPKADPVRQVRWSECLRFFFRSPLFT